MSEPIVRLESFGRGEGHRSFVFGGYRSAIVAKEPGEVRSALEAADGATVDGYHAAGFVSYEAALGLDPAFTVPGRCDGLPLVWFGVFDTREELSPDDTADGVWAEHLEWSPSISPDHYVEDLGKIRAYIGAGDTYQVNHTFRMQADLRTDPWPFYRALCRSQRADYCAYIDTGSHYVLSASPELFFSLKDGIVTTRPMKGTHRRGRWTEEDEQFAEALARSEKNRAENLMIVDLLRNDLGRISRTGSVTVRDLWEVEAYETLFQMTSTVESQLRDEVSLKGMFEALFPCGSVTGTPKIRTMELISEIESEPRGIYTGAIGYVSPESKAAFNVAIRTVAIEKGAGRAVFGVGGGITWDSTAEDEYQECLMKAQVLTERRPDFHLFETVLYELDSGAFLWDRHVDRLDRSAGYFGFRYDPEQIEAELRKATDSLTERSKVRIMLEADGTVSHQTGSLAKQDVYTVSVSPVRVDSNDIFLYHKTSYRKVYDGCRSACPDVDDVILLNERGEVTETAIGNIVIEREGRRLTPPVGSGLLAGTFREDLLAQGEIEEAILDHQDLATADNVYMVNSVREWVPLRIV